jgi:hypothetical protein
MRHGSAALGGLVLALSLAVPAAARTTERFTIDDVLEKEYSCGVVETTQIHGEGTASFAADGSWLGDSIRFWYSGEFVDPATGRVIEQHARQNVTVTPSEVTTRGQGIFLRLAGEGVVMHDVGRLVFDPADQSTLFATPKVLAFGGDFDAKIDAAVCSMFD